MRQRLGVGGPLCPVGKPRPLIAVRPRAGSRLASLFVFSGEPRRLVFFLLGFILSRLILWLGAPQYRRRVVRGDPSGFRMVHEGGAGEARLQGCGCGRSCGGTGIVIDFADPDTVTVMKELLISSGYLHCRQHIVIPLTV